MPRSTVTNATFDAALAALTSPFGAFTRVTDLDAAPTVSPNSHIKVEITGDDTNQTVYISYEELSNDVVAAAIIKEAHGARGRLLDLSIIIEALAAVFADANYDVLTADIQDYKSIVRFIQNMPQFAAFMPFSAFEEVGDSNTILNADFSVGQVNAATTSTITITNETTGLYSWIVLDWGDGSKIVQMEAEDEWVHVYPRPAALAGDETYSVKLIVIGPQGPDYVFTNVVVPEQV